MGLLDFLSPANNSGGGLLGFLNIGNQPQQPQSAQIAQPQSSQLPDFLQSQNQGGFSGFLQGLQNARGHGLIGGLASVAGGAMGIPDAAQAQDLQTKQALFKALAADPNIGPNKAMIAVANPQIFGQLQTAAHQASQDAESKREFELNYKLAQSREARANDTTPTGFMADPNKPSGVIPIPGGPQDPAYLAQAAGAKNNGVQVLGKGGELYSIGPDGQPQILHKNQDTPEASLDDQTVQDMADQYLAGDRTVLTNLGRGAQGAANVVKLREAISNRARSAGIDPKGIVQNFNEQAGALAGQRAVGTRAANISLAANEANNMIPIALDASDKLPRTQYMPWNQMVQAVQKGTSSPELASFVAATNSLVNSYVRAVSPNGVPTDAMREHAYSMLNSAQGPEAYKAVIGTMKQEMQAALHAPEQVKQELRGNAPQSGTKPDPLGIR